MITNAKYAHTRRPVFYITKTHPPTATAAAKTPPSPARTPAAPEQIYPCVFQYAQSLRRCWESSTMVTVLVGPVSVAVYAPAPTMVWEAAANTAPELALQPSPTPDRSVPQLLIPELLVPELLMPEFAQPLLPLPEFAQVCCGEGLAAGGSKASIEKKPTKAGQLDWSKAKSKTEKEKEKADELKARAEKEAKEAKARREKDREDMEKAEKQKEKEQPKAKQVAKNPVETLKVLSIFASTSTQQTDSACREE